MLIDAKLWNENPRIFIISLIKILKPFGFYCLMGPLDYLVSLVIVSRYPTDFFSKKSVVNDKIQSAVEEIIVGYMDKINYDINAVLKG
jgi:predicted MPP superfamily phosphohydrolase